MKIQKKWLAVAAVLSLPGIAWAADAVGLCPCGWCPFC